MATPYFQIFIEDVPSTQDLARDELGGVPVVVIAPGQSAGRGRGGSRWENADRALAVSFAWEAEDQDHRPFSLMAGLAAVRALQGRVQLKWPNDVMRGDDKLGGILVERSQGVVVAGLGLNLYWPGAPEGASGLESDDPGPGSHREVGALWAAEFRSLIDGTSWPIEEYRSVCATLGRDITWEPNGSGIAAGVSQSGALLVETEAGVEEIHAGAVRHVRDR